MSAGWVDPEADDTLEPWAQRDEPPSKPVPVRKPLAGLFQGITHVPPSCPKCGGGDVVERKKDGAIYCRGCDEAFYRHSPAGLLFGLGFWYL